MEAFKAGNTADERQREKNSDMQHQRPGIAPLEHDISKQTKIMRHGIDGRHPANAQRHIFDREHQSGKHDGRKHE